MTLTEATLPTHPRDRTNRVALAALALVCLLPLVWLGDIPFINDEPLLIAAAVDANRAGHLASAGLTGTYGFIYGPLPTWVYQALTAVHHDLLVVAVLHTLLVTVTTAGALWWLSRSLGLSLWFAPVPLLSPYFWFYARVLWDNPFLIPLGALAVAGYAAYLHSRSSAGLRVSIAATVAIPLVHLMSVALIVPLAAHMLFVHWRALVAHARSVAAIGMVALFLAWPYWTYLAATHPPSPEFRFVLDGWVFPLFGGRLLSARQLQYFYGSGPVDGALFGATATISWCAYALVWGGIVVAALLAAHAARLGKWTPRAHIATVMLGTLACQSLVSGISAKFDHPHYYNGVWIALVLLAWFAVDFLVSRRRVVRWSAVAATGLLAGALLLAVGTLALRLHRSSGTRDTYGATLANQQEVARAFARYSPTSDVQVHVSMYERFPHALATLRRLNASRRIDLPRKDLDVRYRSEDPASGAIVLVER